MPTATAAVGAPITARGAAVYKLLDLYTDEPRYVAKLGQRRYDAVCERLADFCRPDELQEPR